MRTAFLLLLIFLLHSVTSQNDCPNGGTYQNIFDKCIYASTDSKTFFDALNYCTGQGGNLVSIHSAFQNSVVAGLLTNPAWIGLYKNNTGQVFQTWTDGTPVNYQAAWDISSCKTGLAVTFNNYIWTCADYTQKLQYVCEFLNGSAPLTTPGVPPDCDNGGYWEPLFQTCIWANHKELGFADAEKECQSGGGHLVSVHNSAQLDRLRAILGEQKMYWDYWLGGQRPYYGAAYGWTDGTPYDYDVMKGKSVNCSYYYDCIEDDRSTNKCDFCDQDKQSLCEFPPTYFVPTTGSLTSPSPNECQNGGFWDDVFQSCLLPGPYELRNAKAIDYCSLRGGMLMSVHSAEQNQHLLHLAITHDFVLGAAFWLGGSRPWSGGNWTWMDGTPFDYDNITDHYSYENNPWYENWLAFEVPSGGWVTDDDFGSYGEGYNFICSLPKEKYIPHPTQKVPTTPNAMCPNGGIYDDFFDKCIYVSPNSAHESVFKFDQAESQCNLRGGHVLSLHSDIENQHFINWAIMNGFALGPYGMTWLGASRQYQSAPFTWNDGTPFDYNNFNLFSKCGLADYYEDFVIMHLPNGSWSCTYDFTDAPFACFLPTTLTSPIVPSNAPTTPDPKCPHGGLYDDLFDACIQFNEYNSKQKRYEKDEQDCVNKGGHLISLHSAAENQRLLDIAFQTDFELNTYVWIGLYRANNTAPWQWTDGTPVDFMGNLTKCSTAGNNYIAFDLTVKGDWKCDSTTGFNEYVCKLPKA